VVGEQAKVALGLHAMNYRKKLADLLEVFRRDDVLGLLTDLIDQKQGCDAASWFADAAKGKPPALPDTPYARLALVYRLIVAVMHKESKFDFHFMCSSAFPGGNLGEKVEVFRTTILARFLEDLQALLAEVVKGLPPKGSVDLWDAYWAVLSKKA
jgi:hypothetical protein